MRRPFQVLRADVVDQDAEALRDRGRGLLCVVGGLLLPGLRLHELLLEQDTLHIRLRAGQRPRQHPLLTPLRCSMGECTE